MKRLLSAPQACSAAFIEGGDRLLEEAQRGLIGLQLPGHPAALLCGRSYREVIEIGGDTAVREDFCRLAYSSTSAVDHRKRKNLAEGH
jgi:hypothetical protein